VRGVELFNASQGDAPWGRRTAVAVRQTTRADAQQVQDEASVVSSQHLGSLDTTPAGAFLLSAPARLPVYIYTQDLF